MKHPKALPFLFFTEMWERFGYYLMIGIFQLFMTQSIEKGGMGAFATANLNKIPTELKQAFLRLSSAGVYDTAPGGRDPAVGMFLQAYNRASPPPEMSAATVGKA